jgi:hypothetical protein
MWFAGDISSDNRHDTKDDGYVGEVGISIKESPSFTYSIALGKMRSESKLSYKGEINNHGEYLALDTDIKLSKDLPIYSTTMVAYGKNDMTIKRGYDNSGTLTHSNGDTNQEFLAFKQRLQYQGKIYFPYIEFNHIKVKTDAYTETGGGYPANYEESKEKVSDWRVGIDANFDIDSANRVITTMEGTYRVQEKGKGVNGEITGLGSFSVDGRRYDQYWMRGTLGIEHTFENRSRFTLTLNRTSQGEDPVFWSGFNYSIPF